MKFKKISKLLLIPVLATVTVGTNANLAEAKTKNYEETMRKYFNGLVERDVNSVIDNSIDSRHENIKEYREFIEGLMENAEDDVMISDYKILEDENPNDEKFTVRNYYENGNIADLNLKVDTKTNKVLVGADFEDMGQYIKKIDNGIRVTGELEENETGNNRAIAQRWGGELDSRGTRTTGVFSTSGTSVAINYTQYYMSGKDQVASLQYELVKKGATGNTTLNTVIRTGDNKTAKQFYFTRTSSGTRFTDVFVRISNKYSNKVKIAGESYI